MPPPDNAETRRLHEKLPVDKGWRRWGPYVSERQWATVREDYSANGNSWDYFPHDHARSRAYRWGEDGLFGITDLRCLLCFAPALWNGQDPILKERLFGLTNAEGNHGEDVKECYYYLDATPTHSYLKGLYKYPQAAYPYDHLVAENRKRGRLDLEYELCDTGIFDDNRYFDVFVEYAKAGVDDILIRITAWNRGPDPAPLHLLPTLWFRNVWDWGRLKDGYGGKPHLEAVDALKVAVDHPHLGKYFFLAATDQKTAPTLLVTENETNEMRLFKTPNHSAYVKDAFHEYVLKGKKDAVNPARTGTKAAFYYQGTVPAGQSWTVCLRLVPQDAVPADPFGPEFAKTFTDRIAEAEEFYNGVIPVHHVEEGRRVARQAYASLIWSKQFYHYVVKDWLEGDSTQPKPPPGREKGRNAEWGHLFCRDILSMPDKWEYPWFAAWDLAFHLLPMARIDPEMAKHQMVTFHREWYMHPSGHLPAYEFNFSDVNPPVQAWATWRMYKMTGEKGKRDRVFLDRVFQKLLLNFTWWVNRKDVAGKNLFGGGFLGLDNISVFDRSMKLPPGVTFAQADGTAWMAFYCLTMMAIALELAPESVAHQDMATKFFEHFVAIADAMNNLCGTGLWDDEDGFYYDSIQVGAVTSWLKIRSLVGLMPLLAVEVLDEAVIDKLPGFRKRLNWFLENRMDLAKRIAYWEPGAAGAGHGKRLLAIPTRKMLERTLRYMLDEKEFLSPFGIRSLSLYHKEHPFVEKFRGQEFRIEYSPGESTSNLYGGNSNWRGPIWFPINFLLVEALQRYHHFFGDSFQVECPTGSGRKMNLLEVSHEISNRLCRLFLHDGDNGRPGHGGEKLHASDPHWRDLVLFHEYFHADDGRGLGANHQTGWTSLVVRLLDKFPLGHRGK